MKKWTTPLVEELSVQATMANFTGKYEDGTIWENQTTGHQEDGLGPKPLGS